MNLTIEDDPTDEISEIAESCRKFILASKVAIAGGVALLLVAMLGLFGAGQSAALASIALMLGGIVSLGSNVSTLRQTDAAINEAEALRSDLISRIDLLVVRDPPIEAGVTIPACRFAHAGYTLRDKHVETQAKKHDEFPL